MNEFDIEKQYQGYLLRVGLSESKMPLIQQKQLRDAFFAGVGQSLLIFRDHVSQIEDEDKAIDTMSGMLQQTIDYWNNRISESLPRN
jgi:hypothetical protein